MKAIFKTVSGLLLAAGFILALGTFGTMDYMDAIGQYQPMSAYMPKLILSAALMAQSIPVFKRGGLA